MLVGDDKNWITLHWIDPGIDTGDVIANASVEVLPDDNGFDSMVKLMHAGHHIFAENLPLLRENKAPHIPQNKITKKDGVKCLYYHWQPYYARISWEQPSDKIDLHIRALWHPKETPSYSGEAYTYLSGHKVIVWKSEVLDEGRWKETKAKPGEILAILGEGLLVKTGRGVILLTDMDIEDGPEGLTNVFEILKPGLPMVFR
jgi:methionyl-tRNA formyltransferase